MVTPPRLFDAEADRLEEIADLNALHLAAYLGREPNLDAEPPPVLAPNEWLWRGRVRREVRRG